MTEEAKITVKPYYQDRHCSSYDVEVIRRFEWHGHKFIIHRPFAFSLYKFVATDEATGAYVCYGNTVDSTEENALGILNSAGDSGYLKAVEKAKQIEEQSKAENAEVKQ
jgi:hypothetical protein